MRSFVQFRVSGSTYLESFKYLKYVLYIYCIFLNICMHFFLEVFRLSLYRQGLRQCYSLMFNASVQSMVMLLHKGTFKNRSLRVVICKCKWIALPHTSCILEKNNFSCLSLGDVHILDMIHPLAAFDCSWRCFWRSTCMTCLCLLFPNLLFGTGKNPVLTLREGAISDSSVTLVRWFYHENVMFRQVVSKGRCEYPSSGFLNIRPHCFL